MSPMVFQRGDEACHELTRVRHGRRWRWRLLMDFWWVEEPNPAMARRWADHLGELVATGRVRSDWVCSAAGWCQATFERREDAVGFAATYEPELAERWIEPKPVR